MKIIRICFVGLMLMAASCANVKNFAIVKNGQPASCIVLPDNAGPTEKHAADELALFLEKVTGAKIAIGRLPAKKSYNIYLGTTGAKNIPRSAAIDQAVSRLQDDGFILAADRKGLRVIGKKPVSVLYGVYDLLKKYAGMRWFAPGDDFEYCPKKLTISVPEQVTVSNPSFRVRRLAWVCANWQSPYTNTWDWMLRNGIPVNLNKWYYNHSELLRNEVDKRGMEFGREGGHCFVNLISDSLFAQHPEYFGLYDGKRTPQDIGDGTGARRQPCTSNPKVVEIMAESLNKILDVPPKGGRYLIGNNDSTLWCQCAECVQLDPPEEKAKLEGKDHFVSTRYWTLVNNIASNVYKAHPDAELWAWAYQNYRYPPTSLMPDPRLFVEACIHGRCYRHSMANLACELNDKYRDILAQWGKLKNPVSTLEYTDATILPLYLPMEKVLAEDLKYYKKIGLDGCAFFTVPPDGTFGSLYQAPHYRESMLTAWQAYYIAAQLLWDIEADYDRIYEDMGSKYYGKTWPVMKEYRALLIRTFMDAAHHVSYGAPQYFIVRFENNPGLEAKLMQLLDEAVKLAGDDQVAVQRVQRDREYFLTYWPTARYKELQARQQKKYNVNKGVDQITIDGKLDESGWQKAEVQADFIATDGKTAANPPTSVKMLYDDKNIYFGIWVMEPEPGKMKITVQERDGEVWLDNSLEIFINAPGTGNKLARIAVNPNCVICDAMGIIWSYQYDKKFDAGIEAKTSVLPDRWIAEIRIPVDSLGVKIKEGETWKINIGRHRCLTDGTEQDSTWCNGVFYGDKVFRPVVFIPLPAPNKNTPGNAAAVGK